MRKSIRPSRLRVIAIVASVLLSGSALAAVAVTVPAQAGTAPARQAAAAVVTGTTSSKLTLANTVTVTNPGAQISPPDAAIEPLVIAAADSDADATLTYAAPDLPAGLAIDPATGVITGTPTTVAVTDVTVTVTDGTGAAGTAVFAWTVGNKVTVTVQGSESSFQGLLNLVAASATDSDKTQTITWSAKPLPPGLSLTTDGTDGRLDLFGRITATGVFKTVVTATDGIGSTGSATITWHVGGSINVLSAASVTTVAGRSMVYRLTYSDAALGDKATWTATGLPAGVKFQPGTLLLYGWPTAAGTHTVVFKEKGSFGTSDQKAIKLVVKAAPNQGAVGQLRLALDGKCLQDPGNRTANGTRVEIENCVSGATERWTVASDGTIRVNGRCLTIAGSGSANGRQLQLWSCTGSTRQVWLQGSLGELVNPASALCVTDPGSSRKNGITPTMGACQARSFEQWTLPAQAILTPVGGLCATDPLGVGSNRTVIVEFSCSGTPRQAWDFEPNGTIRISQHPNVCLTLYKSQPVLWACGAAGNQKWSVNRTGGLGSELTVAGVCLATKSLIAPKATQLVTVKCAASSPRDLWHIQ